MGFRQSFEVDGRLDGLNDYTRACRGNRYAGASMKRRNQDACVEGIRKAGLTPMGPGVWVTSTWVEPDRRRDLDNVAFGKKFILDALVEAGILEDDGRPWVVGFTDVFPEPDKQHPRVAVELEDNVSASEQVALWSAAKKLSEREYKAAKEEAQDELLDAYEASGFDRRDLLVDGQKVGQQSVVRSKGEWVVTDKGAFDAWALEQGLASVQVRIRPGASQIVIKTLEETLGEDEVRTLVDEEVQPDSDWPRYVTKSGDTAVFAETGEVVPGVEWEEGHVTGTRVTGCEPDDVLPIIRQMGLEEREQLFLEGGAE